MNISEARRIALAAQGICDPQPTRRPDVRHFRRAMKRMSLLQLDSVQYLCRSHYLPMFARLGPYNPDSLDRFAHQSNELLEVWGHEASLVPVQHEPLFRWHKERSRQGQTWSHLHKFASENKSYIKQIHSEVKQRGALRPSELSSPRKKSSKGSWGNASGGKIAMEWMFRVGELCVRRDSQFRRVYDLPQRIIPAKILRSKTPSEPDAIRELLRLASQSHGIGSLDCLADYYRIKIRDAAPRLHELVEMGEIRGVEVEGWDGRIFMHKNARCPRHISGATMLSPFDPIVWNRKRIAKLFAFDYKIEIYKPATKREYGYFVLPFLLGDSLAGRLEIKSNRAEHRLELQGAWIEADRDPSRCASAMVESVQRLSKHLGYSSIIGPRKGNLAAAVRQALH